MRKIIKLLIIMGITFPIILSAQKKSKNDSLTNSECLKVTGLAIDEKGFIVNGASVRLFKQNNLLEQVEITSDEDQDHNFLFTLKANEYYTVKVSKPGYVERWIVFYTELPHTMPIESVFTFEFDIVLIKEKQMDDYYLDFPIALIHYNIKTGVFESNMKYTKYIKSKIKEAEEAARLKNESQKRSIVKN